jgi:Zn-dependent protease
MNSLLATGLKLVVLAFARSLNMESDILALGFTWYVVFLFSTTCHEAAHAFAAKLGGDLTAFHSGQVSLDPIPHIRREPFGMVIFPILSYAIGGWMMGWASAPYDPLWAQRNPKRAAWMSLAGPGANFTLVILAAIAMRAGLAAGFFQIPESIAFTHLVSGSSAGFSSGASTAFSILFSLNLLLGVFNLLPLPPLDGFGAVGLLMPESAAARFQGFAMKLRGYSMLGLLVAWRVFNPIFDPVFLFALRALYPA